jgi:hypothetical protein
VERAGLAVKFIKLFGSDLFEDDLLITGKKFFNANNKAKFDEYYKPNVLEILHINSERTYVILRKIFVSLLDRNLILILKSIKRSHLLFQHFEDSMLKAPHTAALHTGYDT